MWELSLKKKGNRYGITKSLVIVVVLIAVIVVVAGAVAFIMLTPQRPTKTEIVIGAAISLSGANVETASHQANAYRLFVKQVNEQGGIYVAEYGKKLPVRLVLYDDQSDASRSVSLFEKLITDDKVDFIIGPYSSTITFAVAPIAEKYKMVMLTPTAGSDKIYQQGWHYVFELWPLASSNPKSVISFMKTKPDIKKVAVVNVAELLARSTAAAMKDALQKEGFEIVFEEEYPKGVTDLRPMLSKIKTLNPDAVIAATFFEDNVLFVRQLREVGFNPKFLWTMVGFDQPEYIEALGKTAEGVCGWIVWHLKFEDLGYLGVRQFYEAYMKEYGKRPFAEAATGYTALQILKQAIEKAGTLDNEKIRQVLLTEEFMTIIGKVKYNEQGINVYNVVYMGQVQNGKLEVVWPQELATAKIWYPKPEWAS